MVFSFPFLVVLVVVPDFLYPKAFLFLQLLVSYRCFIHWLGKLQSFTPSFFSGFFGAVLRDLHSTVIFHSGGLPDWFNVFFWGGAEFVNGALDKRSLGVIPPCNVS